MKLLDFPVLRQTYNYDCGAKALQSVLVYYGIEIREDKIINFAHTNRDGTPIKGIQETLEKHGLSYISKSMNLDEIKHFINNEIPIIIVMQAWAENQNVNWKKDWKDGHYVVIIGYDSNKLYFEDPSSFERTFLEYDEFKNRWHDIDVNGKKYVNYGIAVFGKNHTFNSKQIIHLD